MLQYKLIEYAEKFGENFPYFLVKHLDDEEIIKEIDECLANNTIYSKTKYNKDYDY